MEERRDLSNGESLPQEETSEVQEQREAIRDMLMRADSELIDPLIPEVSFWVLVSIYGALAAVLHPWLKSVNPAYTDAGVVLAAVIVLNGVAILRALFSRSGWRGIILLDLIGIAVLGGWYLTCSPREQPPLTVLLMACGCGVLAAVLANQLAPKVRARLISFRAPSPLVSKRRAEFQALMGEKTSEELEEILANRADYLPEVVAIVEAELVNRQSLPV